MNDSERTLRQIERSVRAKAVRRELVCPHCGSHEGRSGIVKFYACANCGWEFESLAELKPIT